MYELRAPERPLPWRLRPKRRRWSRATISDGATPQWRVALPASAADDAAAPAPNVNVYPTEEQAGALAALLGRGLAAASIGCGNSYLEGMLEARGIDVLAVDSS